MFKHIINNQLGNFSENERHNTITKYHEIHPRKCPRCGSDKIGITYTTGTGACSCGANLMLTAKGLVALLYDEKTKKYTFWFEDGTTKEVKSDGKFGPVFWSEMEHICL